VTSEVGRLIALVISPHQQNSAFPQMLQHEKLTYDQLRAASLIGQNAAM